MCPFLETADIRCAGHLTLHNVMQAFADCADEYRSCPVFAQLLEESREGDRRDARQPILATS